MESYNSCMSVKCIAFTSDLVHLYQTSSHSPGWTFGHFLIQRMDVVICPVCQIHGRDFVPDMRCSMRCPSASHLKISAHFDTPTNIPVLYDVYSYKECVTDQAEMKTLMLSLLAKPNMWHHKETVLVAQHRPITTVFNMLHGINCIMHYEPLAIHFLSNTRQRLLC